ncbi:WD domain, G-beta repeat domain-containing protein [Hirsutella rhossiliensis]|uniref:Probable cytosolic iron-sulfur protein assembly protein 1 n=1 Tax=Hirsutella rhossiliensis TaxID=111463 RepID=A0A9P8N7M1_9HYPO|nr:WD domain, g-beta repeat domain-containing protein [Hirsutella rhossiliensis]KAH0968320.1 WD domain, g-beta repeat domain-containing protein [Hirsutella rhossiliensis]
MASIRPLPPFQPDLHERAWASIPHPTLPLLATTHAKSVTVFSLATLSPHSTLTGGHTRSVRSVAWEPGLPPHKLCLVTGSFDSTAGLWRWDGDGDGDNGDGESDGDKDWEFTLVLEGHESEIKSCAFSPSGAYLATCSRDKTIWIWEDVGGGGPSGAADDEWETLAILNEHEGDVKAVAWCPDVPGRNARRRYSPDVLASASYDNTVRIWREDADAEWVCVAVLEGHEGTVWGLAWESPRPSDAGGGARFPRLLTFSADATIRIWTLREEEEDQDGAEEEWDCTAILPQAHSRDIYAATWSSQSGLVASAGCDGTIALYREVQRPAPPGYTAGAADRATAPMDEEGEPQQHHPPPPGPSTTSWELLTTVPNAHGPYEINHITWCRRHDAAAGARRGEEEMLVTTGDDGLVRPWEVRLGTPGHPAEGAEMVEAPDR